MKKILLFGASGFIGSHLNDYLTEKGCTLATPRVEVRDYSAVLNAIETHCPDIVINATGKTGRPNVDWCDAHPDETLAVNVAGSINIAAASHQKGIYMVQLASGCVYDGYKEGGYSEDDEPNYFGSLYSRSRILSEQALKEFKHVLQLRIRIPILGTSHPKNLIDKLLLYPKLINKLNSCTVIEDFLPDTLHLIEQRSTGLMNMTNIGAMNHESIMRVYQEMVDPNWTGHFMNDAEQADLCLRRSNCVLNVEKREALGAHMPPLEKSLRRILAGYRP
ncbi:sugar nucleotide-binding protein [Candidatus Peregrinibacteria bacterium]|nr:MAG: sugar nucleotide-binding protein [Candidatus Peregrinibacteria bacterium]